MQNASDRGPAPPSTTPELLTGQKAIVTGASSGIGRACAIALAEAGADVAVNYRGGAEKAAEVVGEIEALGRRAIAVQADVSKEDDVKAMFAEVIDAFGTVDILVNNAGLQQDAPFAEMTLEQWNKVIGVNLTG
ncbi:MAG: SDR family NAD(P)-dependent oxidoreductase, partial [Spirochaetia bacterium]